MEVLANAGLLAKDLAVGGANNAGGSHELKEALADARLELLNNDYLEEEYRRIRDTPGDPQEDASRLWMELQARQAFRYLEILSQVY